MCRKVFSVFNFIFLNNKTCVYVCVVRGWEKKNVTKKTYIHHTTMMVQMWKNCEQQHTHQAQLVSIKF